MPLDAKSVEYHYGKFVREDDSYMAAPHVRLADWAYSAAEDKYKPALDEWLAKTEWVKETSTSAELGMHRADVMKERILLLQTKLLAHELGELPKLEAKPMGWVTMWPVAGWGHSPVYHHGPDKPDYGPELNAKLIINPVYGKEEK